MREQAPGHKPNLMRISSIYAIINEIQVSWHRFKAIYYHVSETEANKKVFRKKNAVIKTWEQNTSGLAWATPAVR